MGRMVNDAVPAARCLGRCFARRASCSTTAAMSAPSTGRSRRPWRTPSGCGGSSVTSRASSRPDASGQPPSTTRTSSSSMRRRRRALRVPRATVPRPPDLGLARCAAEPTARPLLHRLPLHDGGEFTTLQTIEVDRALYGVRTTGSDGPPVGGRARAEGGMTVRDRKCVVPFHPDLLATPVGVGWRRTAR